MCEWLFYRSDYTHVIEESPDCLAAQLNLALLQQCEGKHMLAWENLTKLLENHKGTTKQMKNDLDLVVYTCVFRLFCFQNMLQHWKLVQ